MGADVNVSLPFERPRDGILLGRRSETRVASRATSSLPLQVARAGQWPPTTLAVFTGQKRVTGLRGRGLLKDGAARRGHWATAPQGPGTR